MPAVVFLPVGVPPKLPGAPHPVSAAMAASVIRETDSEHRSGRKPWAVSPLAETVEGQFGFELRTPLDSLVERVVDGWNRLDYLQLGRSRIRTFPGARIEAWTDWDSLLKVPGAVRAEIECLTPLAFRSGNDYLPPTAGLLLGGLARQFALWGPEPIDLDIRRFGASLDLGGARLDLTYLRRRPVVATVGSMILDMAGSDESDLGLAWSCLAISEFVAVGAHSTAGFGLLRVTWR